MKKKYMHLINGQPAEYHGGEQICHVGFHGVRHFADTLYQIRKEQRLSTRWRRKQGFRSVHSEYGYVIIRI